MKQKLSIVLIIILLVIIPLYARASDVEIKVGPDFTSANIAKHCEYLKDSTKQMTYNDVITGHSVFTPYNKSSFQFGLNNAAHWVRFSINKRGYDTSISTNDLFIRFDNAAIGSFELFVPVIENGKPQIVKLTTGWLNAKSSGETSSLNPTVSLPKNIDDTRQIYLRIWTPYLPTTGCQLMAAKSQRSQNSIYILFVGISVGILGAMFLYNLVLFVFLRDINYLLYISYIGSTILYQTTLSGLFNLISPSAGAFFLLYVSAFCNLMIICAVSFVISFLELKQRARKHYFILTSILIVQLGLIFMALVGFRFEANQVTYFISIFIPFIIMSASIVLIRNGFRPAIYFLAAWISFLIGSSIFIIRGMGILPQTALTHNGVFIGSAIESILLSFALAYRIRLLQNERNRLLRRELELNELSVTDELTHLFNRRYLNAKLDESIKNAIEKNDSLSVLMMDIDLFKSFNDTYGHTEGDKVLAEMGSVILRAVRGYDIPCRFGGEEFTVILRHTDITEAMIVAEKIRTRFSDLSFQPSPGSIINKTVSIGIAQLNSEDCSLSLLARADKALYKAKDEGRNRSIANIS